MKRYYFISMNVALLLSILTCNFALALLVVGFFIFYFSPKNKLLALILSTVFCCNVALSTTDPLSTPGAFSWLSPAMIQSTLLANEGDSEVVSTSAAIDIKNSNSLSGSKKKLSPGFLVHNSNKAKGEVRITFIPPMITLQPSDSFVNEGGLSFFTANATGYDTVQWQTDMGTGVFNDIPDGGIYNGVNSTSLTINNVTAPMNGYHYQAVFTNVDGSTTTNQATLTVFANTPPVVTTQPFPQTVNAGENTSFTAAANGEPIPTVQWQVDTGSGFTNINNDAVYGGATSNMLTITGALASMNNYVYRAVFTNIAGTTDSNSAILNVNSAPTVTTQPIPQTVNAGGTTSFTAAADGTPIPTVRWQENTGSGFININNGGVYSGATSNTLTITGAPASMNTYTYRAVYTNVAGTVNSNSAALNVNSAPTITTQPTPQTVNAGGTTSFTAAASGSPSPTVQWQVSPDNVTFTTITDGGIYSGTTTNTLNISNVPTTINGHYYRALYTNIVNDTPTNGALLSVNSTLVINTSSLPNTEVGADYSQPIAVNGGVAPYAFIVSDGALPPGLTLNSSGVISGTPTTKGSFNFTVQVTDAANTTASKSYSILVVFIPPNPLSNPSITGLINSQVLAVQFFGQMQIDQITNHLQQLRQFNLKNNKISVNLNNPFAQRMQQEISFSNLKQNPAQQEPPWMQQNRAGFAVAPQETMNQTSYSSPNLSSYTLENLNLNKWLLENYSLALWGAGNTNYGKLKTSIDNREHFNIDGLVAGVDYLAFERLISGLALNYVTDQSDIDNLNASSKAKQLSLTGYASYNPLKNVFIDVLIGGGSPSFNNLRQSTTTAETINSNRTGKMFFGSLEVANLFKTDTLLTQLFARIDRVSARLNSYTEQAGLLSLTYLPISSSNTALSTGIVLSKPISFNLWTLTPMTRINYSYNSGSSNTQSLYYTNLGPSTFGYNFNLGNIPKNIESLSLSLDLANVKGASILLGWMGSTGSAEYFMHTAELKLSYALS